MKWGSGGSGLDYGVRGSEEMGSWVRGDRGSVDTVGQGIQEVRGVRGSGES